jgi:hypothetical protein
MAPVARVPPSLQRPSQRPSPFRVARAVPVIPFPLLETRRKEELRRKMEEFKRKRDAEAKEKEKKREREALFLWPLHHACA